MGSLSRANSQNEKYSSNNNNNNNKGNDTNKRRKARRPYSLFVDSKSINKYHNTIDVNHEDNNLSSNNIIINNPTTDHPHSSRRLRNLDLNIYKHSNSTTNLLSPISNKSPPNLPNYSPILSNYASSFSQTQFLDNSSSINHINHNISPIIEPVPTFPNNYNNNNSNSNQNDSDVVINTVPTIGVNIKKKLVNIDNRLFDCLFCDSAGKSEYQNVKMMQQLINNCHGIIIMYDITNYTSFVHCLNEWLKKFIGLPFKRVYLIGNKNDLINERQVNMDDVNKLIDLAKEQFNIKIVNFFEINCYDFELVNDTINTIIMDLIMSNSYDQDLKLTDEIDRTANYSSDDEQYFTALESNPLLED